ncbi:SDR family NAD(P)-dependent oxidoreductase [bacterium]|nr:SDR family NAD(P)-dependent oxidoreductase [bacterium]
MNRLSGKTALITGASSGIGKATAKELAKVGVNLTLLARREELLNELKDKLIEINSDITIEIIVADVRDRDDISIKLKDRVFDILINNAGLASGLDKIQNGDIDDWEKMIDTNIKGVLYVTKAIINGMIAKNSGHIINIGSIAGHQVYPLGNVYNASKYAIKALSEAINIDLVGTNIRVSSIDPGAVETEFSIVRFHGDSDRASNVYNGFTPLKGEDIAETILFVLNAPEHVNIQNILVTPTAQRNVYITHKEL